MLKPTRRIPGLLLWAFGYDLPLGGANMSQCRYCPPGAAFQSGSVKALASHALWNHQAPQMLAPPREGSCDIFIAHLAGYMEGTLDPAVDGAMTCHIQPQTDFGSCKSCLEALRQVIERKAPQR